MNATSHRALVFETLFGTPNFEPAHPEAFVFIGVPFDGGTTAVPGARFGPSAIRAGSQMMSYHIDPVRLTPSGFLNQSTGRLELEGFSLADAGDVVLPPGCGPRDAHHSIRAAVGELLDNGAIPVVLGGDHSVTLPVLEAYPSAPMGVIQIDAHTDLGDVEDGRVHHGNVFRAVLDRLPHVKRVVQVGLRGFLSGGEDQTHERAVPVGIDRVSDGSARIVLDNAPDDIPYYLSIDIDGIDPAFAPSTGSPVVGGFRPEALFRLVTEIGLKRRIIGIDVTEVGAIAGPTDPTGQLAATAILTAMAAVARRALEARSQSVGDSAPL